MRTVFKQRLVHLCSRSQFGRTPGPTAAGPALPCCHGSYGLSPRLEFVPAASFGALSLLCLWRSPESCTASLHGAVQTPGTKTRPAAPHNGPMHAVALQGTTEDCVLRADVHVAHVGFLKEIFGGWWERGSGVGLLQENMMDEIKKTQCRRKSAVIPSHVVGLEDLADFGWSEVYDPRA